MASFTLPFRNPAIALGPISTTSSSATSVPPAEGFPVSIGGRGYMVDTFFEPYRHEAFSHKSISPQRQSLHFTNIPDDGTVSTEGLWRREARDWSLGSGQIYFDRKDSDPARFYKSKGIDPWTQWKVSLLQDTTKQLDDCYRAVRAGSYVYYITADQSAVKFRSSWAGSDTTLSGTADGGPFPNGVVGAILDITSNGTYLFALTTFGVYQFVLGSSTPLHQVIDANYISGFKTVGSTSPTATTLTSSAAMPTTVPYYIQLDNEYIKVTAVSGVTVTIERGKFGTTAATHNNNTVIQYVAWLKSADSTNPLSGVIAWVGDRLMVAINNLSGWNTTSTIGVLAGKSGSSLFDISQTTGGYPRYFSAPPTAASFYTHPDPNWIWSGITASSSQIYFSGYSSTSITNGIGTGSVFRSTIQQQQATALTPGLLTLPVSALPLLAGEYPTCIKGYLNYIFVGTNKGIRMCQSLNAYDPVGGSGDLKAGPLLPNITQPVTSPVTAIVGNDRYVYFAWNNYDASSTGIGRLDLTRFNAELAPAYASDLMVQRSTSTKVTNLAWDPFTDSPLMTLDTNKAYTADTTKCVSSGTIQSGLITYGIPDYKNAVSLDTNVDNAADTVNSSISYTITADTNDPASAGLPYSGLDNKHKFTFGQLFGEQYQITTTLTASATGLPPSLNRTTLKALPGIPSGITIMVPILLYDPTEVDGQQRAIDPYEEYAFLEDLRQKQIVVQYVEGTYTANVTVDLLHWMPERRRNLYQGGYHGDLIVTLKTVTG